MHKTEVLKGSLPFKSETKTYQAAGIKNPYVFVSSTTQCKLKEELITWNFKFIEYAQGKMEGVRLSASLKVENIPGAGKVTAGREVNRLIEIDAEQIMSVFTEDKK